MGGMIDFLRGGKREISSRTAVILTDAGKRRAESEEYAGRNYAILATIYGHRPHLTCTVSDIANETNIDIAEIKERVKVLAKQGFVRLMSEYEVG